MKINIIDISHLLTIARNDIPVKDFSRFSEISIGNSRNNAYPANHDLAKCSSSASINNRKQRNSSNKCKTKAQFQIVEGKKLILYRVNKSACSYQFDRISDSQKSFDIVFDWIEEQKKKRSGILELITCHNYSEANIISLMDKMGKKLIVEGISFQFWTKLKSFGTNKRLSEGKNWSQDQQTILQKQVKFVSEMKQYLNEIKLSGYGVQRFWIISSSLTACFSITQRKNECAKTIENIVGQFIRMIKPIKKGEAIQMRIGVSTVINQHSSQCMQECKIKLDEAVCLRNEVKSFAIRKKNITEENKENNKMVRENAGDAKTSKKDKDKDKFLGERKRSEVLQTRYRKQLVKNTQINSFSQSQPSIDESRDDIMEVKSKKETLTYKNNEDAFSTLMAQNMHLKWQVAENKKCYEQQSKKYLQKNKRKIEALKQQRSLCLQENGRLRKENEELLAEVVELKKQYEEILLSRKQYEASLQGRLKEQQRVQLLIKEEKIQVLEQMVRNLQIDKQSLEKEIESTKMRLEDCRKRNKEKLEQLFCEMEKYKNVCEQMKVAYDQLERQWQLDQDRCLNLEIRCKKYQDSVADLNVIRGSKIIQLEPAQEQRIKKKQIEALLREDPNYFSEKDKQLGRTQKQNSHSKLKSLVQEAQRREKKEDFFSKFKKQKKKTSERQITFAAE